MVQLGNEPEGLTEALRHALASLPRPARAGRRAADAPAARRQRDRHPPERQSPPDRRDPAAPVDHAGPDRGPGPGARHRTGLGADGVGSPAPEAHAPRPVRPPSGPPASTAPTRQPGAQPAPRPSPATGTDVGSSSAYPPALDAVRVAWPELVAEVRARSRFLGEALAATTPTALEVPWLTVELAEPNPLVRRAACRRRLERWRRCSSGRSGGRRVSAWSRAAPAESTPAPAPRKLTEASLKADRLRGFRSKDPTLDTAADALDLEIVD